MKAMLSQPMAGKSEEEIVATRERAIRALEDMGYEVVNTLFTDEWYNPENMRECGVEKYPALFSGKIAGEYEQVPCGNFCKGWEQARGCRVEHEAAKAYGLQILYEDSPQEQPQAEARPYIGVKRVNAMPQEKDGLPGYHVIYEDGYESWSPKDVFERAYLPIARPDKLTENDIKSFMDMAADCVVEKRGDKTTLVQVELPSGWIEYEVSSCVDPANYDHALGTQICLNHIADRLWSHLGFVLQWADHGLKTR